MKRRTFLAGALASASASALALKPAAAQAGFPSKPVKLIVPYGPGSATDVITRLLAEQMRRNLNAAVVVDNKPGATGIVAIEEMARARPDGHTVMVGNVSTNALTPLLLARKMSINYERDVQVVARVASIPIMLCSTTKDFPPKTVKELVAYAKERPGKLRYVSAGFGAFQQLDTEHLAKRAGIELVHIPIKAGGQQMMRDVANGDAHLSWFSIGNVQPMVKAGNIRPLAIALEQRHPDWPDVPTMAEEGYPGVGSGQWQAAFAPAATPAPVIETLNRAFAQAVADPAVQAVYAKGGIVAQGGSPAEAKAWIDQEMGMWRKLIAELNISIDD